MNKLVLLSFVCTLFSCHPPKSEKSFVEYNSVKDIESIYGVFDLKLGITTVSDVKKSYKPKYQYDKLEPDYHIGFYKTGLTNSDDRKMIETAIKNNHTMLSQYYYSDYTYNGMKIGRVSMFFLDDILVGIHIGSTWNIGNYFNLLTSFIEKYGDGIGSEKSDIYRTWDSENNCYTVRDLFSEEKREWDNGILNVIYYNRLKSESYRESESHEEYILYTIKDKYLIFDEMMKNAIKSEKEALRVQKDKKANSSI